MSHYRSSKVLKFYYGEIKENDIEISDKLVTHCHSERSEGSSFWILQSLRARLTPARTRSGLVGQVQRIPRPFGPSEQALLQTDALSS